MYDKLFIMSDKKLIIIKIKINLLSKIFLRKFMLHTYNIK